MYIHIHAPGARGMAEGKLSGLDLQVGVTRGWGRRRVSLRPARLECREEKSNGREVAGSKLKNNRKGEKKKIGEIYILSVPANPIDTVEACCHFCKNTRKFFFFKSVKISKYFQTRRGGGQINQKNPPKPTKKKNPTHPAPFSPLKIKNQQKRATKTRTTLSSFCTAKALGAAAVRTSHPSHPHKTLIRVSPGSKCYVLREEAALRGLRGLQGLHPHYLLGGVPPAPPSHPRMLHAVHTCLFQNH